ncbi:hypothetical protein EI94DRAFT_1756478 [Lactarius quietus]|nr:hypothetical protein EI94DRAFT_1756478 [Lactarius quietus]
MGPSQPNSREYQLQAIDAEIKSRRQVFTTIFSLIQALTHGPVASSPHTSCAVTQGNEPDHLPWLRVAHIALNQPILWSRFDFTTFTSASVAEIIARTKMVPLHFEARVPIGHWNDARYNAFQDVLQANVSRTCHLDISSEEHFHLRKTLEGLISPAPILEYLSLSNRKHGDWTKPTRVFIPDNIFDGTTPRLSRLVLMNCDISWKSPLLQGLKHLDIREPSETPDLSAWLDTLAEMPQLRTLTLHSATPVLPLDASLPSVIERIVTLPSLVTLDISASARSCGLALAHLSLPALTQLYLKVTSHQRDGRDVQEILPHVSRHTHRLQHTQPLQSLLVLGESIGVDILAWTIPDIDVKFPNPTTFLGAEVPASPAFSFKSGGGYLGSYIGAFDVAMATLPLDNLVTLISQNRDSPLKKEVALLQSVHLSRSAARGFTKMLLEDNGGRELPLLPSLTKLILVRTGLSARRTFRLCDVLMKRVEQGVPLQVLDIHACFATSRAVKLLSEIVVDVLGPEETFEESEETMSMWASAASGLVAEDSGSEEVYYEDDPDTGSDEEEWVNSDTDDGQDEEDADIWESYFRRD